MKILMVNKFLHPNGGSETYIFKLGEYLNAHGHEVQFFGMEHAERVVGNHAESYTSNMDFHTGKLEKILYPFKVIYSIEARKKIRKVLEDFRPDIVHLNNINFQLTPSIIYEIKKHNIPIVYTAHDYQWVCPNHMLMIPATDELCERCVGGKFIECAKHNCIHNSKVKSLLASVEAYLYKAMKTYRYVDVIICPSFFLEKKLERYSILKEKTVMLHNFIDDIQFQEMKKEDYVLYFGRLSREKGIGTLLEVCKELSQISFKFAGNGPLEKQVEAVENIDYVGFRSGNELRELIGKAKFCVFPAEWYDNCPFAIMEAQAQGTSVVAANIGGIPELVGDGKTGILFESGKKESLRKAILTLYNDDSRRENYQRNCRNIEVDSIERYCQKLLSIYQKIQKTDAEK